MGVKQAIKSLDAFPRAEDHLLQKTQSGALGDELSFFFSFFVIRVSDCNGKLIVFSSLLSLLYFSSLCFWTSDNGNIVPA